MSGKVKIQSDHPDEPEYTVPSDQEPENDEFPVERILAEGTGPDGKVRYLVKWEGYEDYESTWELAEQFCDPQTIAAWERQRDKGDVLDKLELDRLISSMYEHRNSMDDMPPSGIISQETPPNDDDDDQPARKRFKPSQLIDGPLPLLNNNAVSASHYTPKTKTEPRANTAPSSSSRRPVREPPTRTPSQGTPFRNLQHMHRTRKKNAQERAVDPNDPALTMITFGPASPKRSPSPGLEDGSLFYPETATAMDTDISSHRQAQKQPSQPAAGHMSSEDQGTTRPGSALKKKLLTHLKMPAGISNVPEAVEVTGLPPSGPESLPENVTDLMANTAIASPVMTPAPAFTSAYQTTEAKNGRIWKKNELVVHIVIGEHEIGPVKIVDLDTYSRGVLFNFKKLTRSYEIRLKFPHEEVLNGPQLVEASNSWYDHAQVSAPVVPFSDTAQASQEFSQHLQQHDSTAVWTHPELDLILFLFAPKSAFWQQHYQYRGRGNLPDLMVEFRRQITSVGSVRPHFKPTRLCKFWARGPGSCRMGDRCMFAHPAQVVPEQDVHALPDVAATGKLDINMNADSSFNHDDAFPKDERPLPRRRMSEAGAKTAQLSRKVSESKGSTAAVSQGSRRKSIHETPAGNDFKSTPSADVVPTTGHQPGIAPNIASIEVGSQSGDLTEIKTHSAEPGHDLDWTFDHDFRKLVSGIKNPKPSTSTNPFIVIALPEQFHEQITALKDWAGKHTGSRLIFVLGNSVEEWKMFKDLAKPTVPNVLLFHESHPTYTQLPDFANLLFRHETVCYALSWKAGLDGKRASYNVSPLFPTNDLILITEAAMISKPSRAAYILEWFRSKKISGKLMLRPNVQDFLRDWALRRAGSSTPEEVDQILGLLVLCSEMSPAVDVTQPGAAASLAGSLGGQDLVTQASFVPFPQLPDYDSAPSASISTEAITTRDEFLLEYFANFSVVESRHFRRCVVLHDGSGRPTETTQHLVYRSLVSFAKEQERKSKDEAKA